MKRFIFVLLAVLTAFTFTACSKKEKVSTVDLSHIEYTFSRAENAGLLHIVITADVDIENLVVECELFGHHEEVLDTLDLEVGRVKKNRHYRVFVTGWSTNAQATYISNLVISDAWGIIKK